MDLRFFGSGTRSTLLLTVASIQAVGAQALPMFSLACAALLSSNGVPSSSLAAVVSWPLVGGSMHTVERHSADEKVELRGDADDHPPVRQCAGRSRLALDRDIGIAAGVVQLLDREREYRKFQERSVLERQQPLQLGPGQGLIGGSNSMRDDLRPSKDSGPSSSAAGFWARAMMTAATSETTTTGGRTPHND